MNTKLFDILLVGSIAGLDIPLAEYLSRKGLSVALARQKLDAISTRERIEQSTEFMKALPSDHILEFENPNELLKIAQSARLIVTLGGSLINYLKARWLFRGILGIPPVIYWHTGADIVERAVEKSLKGVALRHFMATVDVNVGLPYPDAQRIYSLLKTPNLRYWLFPYLLPEISRDHSIQKGDQLRIFHPSHLDFKVNDPGAHRLTSKGNDRFICAYAQAIKGGLRASCVMLERGKDVEPAKALIHELGIADKVQWMPHLSRDELALQFQLADLVVDQFDVGALGGIAVEAMAMGKPVLTWVNEKAASVSYPEMPPVLNAPDEEGIYRALMHAQDADYLRERGLQSKAWVFRYHDWQSCLDPLITYFYEEMGQSTLN